ncbi:hypothetical protein FRC04_001438 [Tulasnella sp. 424]|nr:hypothetical protein FRC04_001438 [Tulasnella sp. 424]KAG8972712.1 hypothetical protein FRC05_009633 [Tulasnella sp. 425]
MSQTRLSARGQFDMKRFFGTNLPKQASAHKVSSNMEEEQTRQDRLVERFLNSLRRLGSPHGCDASRMTNDVSDGDVNTGFVPTSSASPQKSSELKAVPAEWKQRRASLLGHLFSSI